MNEKTSNRENANRLFDSQNNNKGGYNTGDRLSSKAGDNPQRVYHMVSKARPLVVFTELYEHDIPNMAESTKEI